MLVHIFAISFKLTTHFFGMKYLKSSSCIIDLKLFQSSCDFLQPMFRTHVLPITSLDLNKVARHALLCSVNQSHDS